AEVDLRIGIATGEALVGSIGSEIMMNYTIMGDTVNLASRLEAANKLYGTRSLVAEATVAKIDAAIEFREIDRLVLLGQTHAVFELLGQRGEVTPPQNLLRTRMRKALQHTESSVGRTRAALSPQLSKPSRATGRRWRS